METRFGSNSIMEFEANPQKIGLPYCPLSGRNTFTRYIPQKTFTIEKEAHVTPFLWQGSTALPNSTTTTAM